MASVALNRRPGCGSGHHESKFAAEGIVRDSGLDYIAFKAGVISGPGRGSRQDPFQRGPLRSDHDGFSLHPAVRVPAGCRERLEKLRRYAARPPIVEDRLSLLPDSRVTYRLKKRYRDGSTHVVLDPLTILDDSARSSGSGSG